MDLESSPGYIYCKQRIGVLSKEIDLYGQETHIYQQKETERKENLDY